MADQERTVVDKTLYDSVVDVGENTLVLVLSVLLVQLWGSFILLKIKSLLRFMNWDDATNDLKSLLFVTGGIVTLFYVLNLQPHRVVAGVNFAKHI